MGNGIDTVGICFLSQGLTFESIPEAQDYCLSSSTNEGPRVAGGKIFRPACGQRRCHSRSVVLPDLLGQRKGTQDSVQCFAIPLADLVKDAVGILGSVEAAGLLFAMRGRPSHTFTFSLCCVSPGL